MSTTKPPDDRPRFMLELVALPVESDVPATVRLRHILKRLLRTHGFKCLWGREGGRENQGEERQ